METSVNEIYRRKTP